LSLSVESKGMKLLLRAVDEKSRHIIAYILRERHAKTRALADLIHASSDMEVLIKIRKVINPKAQQILGAALLTLEKFKIDPLTGEKTSFSWWAKEELLDNLYYDGLLDIFDEKKTLRVVALLPPGESNVEVEVKDGFFTISGKKYHKETALFCPVEKNMAKTINNGVLEVKLYKVR